MARACCPPVGMRTASNGVWFRAFAALRSSKRVNVLTIGARLDVFVGKLVVPVIVMPLRGANVWKAEETTRP